MKGKVSVRLRVRRLIPSHPFPTSCGVRCRVLECKMGWFASGRCKRKKMEMETAAEVLLWLAALIDRSSVGRQ